MDPDRGPHWPGARMDRVGFDKVLGFRRIGDPSKIDEMFDAITFKTGTPDAPGETVETSEAGVTAETSEAGVTAKTSAPSIMATIPKTPPDL